MSNNYRKSRYKNRELLIPNYETRVLEELTKMYFKPFTDKMKTMDTIVEEIESNLLNDDINFIVRTDIKSFYNSIDIGLLKRKVDYFLSIHKPNENIMKLLDDIFLENNKLNTGSSLSPILSSLYISETIGELSECRINFINYYDDFIIFSRDLSTAKEELDFLERKLNEIGLNINKSKTSIKSKFENNSFLGLNFKYMERTKKVVWNIRKSTLKRYEKRYKNYLEKIKFSYNNNDSDKVESLIKKMNVLSYSAYSRYGKFIRFKQNFKFSNRIIDDIAKILNAKEEKVVDFKRLKNIPIYYDSKNNHIVRLKGI